MPTVMFAPEVTPLDDCEVVIVGDLQFENAMGPAKSLSVDVNDGAERVCGRNVFKQPWKPALARSIPPSMNAFVRSVDVGAPVAFRQTHPPQVMPLAPVFTPKDTIVAPLFCDGIATY